MEILHRLRLGTGPRLPLLLQTEAAECGLACLGMLAGHHGNHVELAELRRRFGLSLKGATLLDLVGIAERLGLTARPLRLDMKELRQLRPPCILHWDLNHFVVLAQVGRNDVVIHDPAAGRRRLPLAEVARHFTGVALELAPVPGFARQPPAPQLRLTQVMGRVVGLRRSLLQVLAMALAIEVFAVLNPFFVQWVVDHALVSADRDLLVTLALGFGLVMLLRQAVNAMRGWTLIGLSASLKVQGRANLFHHLVRLPAAFFEMRHLGDIYSRFGSMEAIQQALTTDLVEALLDGLFAAITLAIMVVLSPALAAIVVAAAAFYGLLRWAAYRPLREASMESIVWSARADSHLLETLRAMNTIKLLGGQDERRAHWLNLLVEGINRDLTTKRLRLFFRVANGVLMGALAIVVVWLGALRVMDGVFSVGMMLAFVAYKDQFMGRISEVIDKAVDLRMLRLHVERLADIVLSAPEAAQPGTDIGLQRFEPSLALRDVRFRYAEHEPWVLDGVDLDIAPGESVAITGTSGCGKTTLLKLLASLLQPTAGEIRVGGHGLARVGTERYRRMLGVVLQDDQLLAGSIADNISFFAARPDARLIEACARAAAIHDDIAAMAMGYNTLIGDMGTSLSGGQKQRVLLARALYRRPRILLLDEATSHLDVGLEKAVNEAVRRLRITRVIVAHRPETIRCADRVIVLERGRVVKDVRNLDGARAPSPPRATG